LKAVPYQRRWVDDLQQLQLKLEVAGTSRIEGADFAEGELEQALRESGDQLLTRSQRQAHAAVQTYRWLAQIPADRPVDEELIKEVHRRIVTGADDDHCPPGRIRTQDQNVTFGSPPHRGSEGGDECSKAFAALANATQREFKDHDPLVQALGLHYHFAAMHPFLDGNGRTARALEALLLQRAGLKDTLFIAMSNYYYDEKNTYLAKLAEVRRDDFDLTPFINFGLRGIALQSQRLLRLLNTHIQRALFRNLMHDLFARLQSPRKKVLGKRHLKILEILLEQDGVGMGELIRRSEDAYRDVANRRKALIRDLSSLLTLNAIRLWRDSESGNDMLAVRLEWPSEITESAFFEQIKKMPKAKMHAFLAHYT
jgi:Fic family protein